MSVPADLTATTIVTEAFNRAGKASPSAGELTRAQTYFLMEIINEIWTRPQVTRFGPAGDTRLKTLQCATVQPLTINRSKYPFPTDFDEEITMTLLEGAHTGTATAGGATSITLAAAEDVTATGIEGRNIVITGGTGANQMRQCISYNATTLAATIDTAWDTNPDVTSTYLIVDSFYELDEETTDDFLGIGHIVGTGRPSFYSKIDESGVAKFMLDGPPDKTYAILIRYYANVNKIDLASALMTKIYNNWRSVLVPGVAVKVCNSEDDSRYAVNKAEYEQNLNNLILKELPAGDEFVGFTT